MNRISPVKSGGSESLSSNQDWYDYQKVEELKPTLNEFR